MVRAALVIVCMLAHVANAEPWYRGRHGRNRVIHLSITVVGGVLYPLTTPIEARLAADPCRWCAPPAIDRSVRDALRWEEHDATARQASHVAGFVVAPLVAGGLVLLYTPPTWSDVIDDAVPIVESVVVATWVTRGVKLLVGRERPNVHFGVPEDDEDNLSFPSGHTSRAVAAGVAAAIVARARGYASEPYIWAAGAVIGAATGYLRIAADKHYMTDALAGAVLGVASGLTVPVLMRRDVQLVPTHDGLAVAGVW